MLGIVQAARRFSPERGSFLPALSPHLWQWGGVSQPPRQGPFDQGASLLAGAICQGVEADAVWSDDPSTDEEGSGIDYIPHAYLHKDSNYGMRAAVPWQDTWFYLSFRPRNEDAGRDFFAVMNVLQEIHDPEEQRKFIKEYKGMAKTGAKINLPAALSKEMKRKVRKSIKYTLRRFTIDEDSLNHPGLTEEEPSAVVE